MMSWLSKMRSRFPGFPGFAQREPELTNEMQQELHAQAERGITLERLMHSPGWKIIENEMRARRMQILEALARAPLTEVFGLQAQLKELDFLLQVVPEAVEMGRQARESLTEAMKREES